ncbi:DNA repair protein rad50 [Pleodorina starrii]|uniref:DNA repair protein RAD50 n=1 Tax=Pleodorina starrii TaxID=330485 RepID=A0A9W6EZR6_9CHLO|nr:DNA repair protein rad50 [Pleodorina starrii]GLC50894.1 DNA repair protein rad50 [Pleodorina starrii]GLC73913.1 DNA repair protein rad50 [Pleodorina starrii]
MCTVEKILIKGIRSFSPDNEYIIEFYKPLTIIVGSNGAGKTTIIECLRNATTGELPPNTRQGQGFVHDPKVAGETEVKAQIKLSFRTAAGQPIYVTRSFQLTQKKTALQFKSLDAVLSCRNKNTGQRESVTYRCADLDRMVPTLMGVSKAVLENVIFVHQEESNWPLAEGKVLKDKFDDIFAATKYTKALEALRKLRTEKSQALKEYKLSMETLRQVKDMAAHHTSERDAAKSRVADCQAQANTLETKIRDLDQQRSALAAKLADIDCLARDMSSRQGQLEQLRATNREREERFASEGHEEFEESMEELQAHLATSNRSAAEKQQRCSQLEREVEAGRARKAEMAAQYQRDCLRQGQLAGEAATHASNLAERDRAIRATAVALALPLPPEQEQELGGAAAAGPGGAGGGGGAISSAAAEAFCGEVAAKVRELGGRVGALRENARVNEGRLSFAVDAATAQVARAQEGLRMKRVQLEENRAAISNCGAQIQCSQFTEVSARALREDAERAEEFYRRKQAEEQGSDAGRQLEEARREVELQGRRIQELRAERQRAAAAAESSAKLRLKRTDLESKEEQLQKTLSARRNELVRVLGLPPGQPLPAAGSLRGLADELLAQLRTQEAEQLRVSQEAHRVAEAAKNTLAIRRSEATRCGEDLERLRRELRQGVAAALGQRQQQQQEAAQVDEEEYSNQIAAVVKLEDKRRNKLGKANAVQTMFGEYKARVGAGECCPLCRRDFNDGERRVCLDWIEMALEEVPSSIEKSLSELQALQRQLEALRGLQPTWVRLCDLKARLPQLREAEGQLEGQAEELENKAMSLQMDYVEVQGRLRELSRLSSEVVWHIDRMAGEAEALRREIAVLDPAAAPGAFGSSSSASALPLRSVSDIDAELGGVEAARQRAEQVRDGAAERLARQRDEVLGAQRAAMAAQQRAMEAVAAVNKVNELQNKIRELEAANGGLEEDLRSAAVTLAPLEAERDKLVRQRDEARQVAQREVAEAEEKLRSAQLHQSQLSDKARVVSEYEARGRGAELTRVAAQLAAATGQMEAEGRALEEREEQLKAIRAELVSDAALRRDVANELEMRAGRRAEEEMAGELAAMEARVAQVGDPVALQRQAAALTDQREALRSRQDQLRGHVAAAQAAAARAQTELNEAKYRDIQQRFQTQQLTVKTTEMAMSDLDKYYKALEKALLVFHTTKMADINKIIKELWQKTYRGQDIDYIQIRADTEGAGARSYNYRVVMASGATELDMRGRCSAGQKVLACLIIRLALAETFCLNCGILALDEPTTNLDAENSASLARALRSLMESRSGQENFQLIVITHDETFAQLIGTREYVDVIWRVTKHPDTLHTLVTPEAFRD